MRVLRHHPAGSHGAGGPLPLAADPTKEMENVPVAMLRRMMVVGAVLMAAACGGDDAPSGEYGRVEAGQWFTIMNFRSGNQVTLTMIGSPDSMAGTFRRDGSTVAVTAAGETRTLRIDGNGCLDGGPGNSFFSGTICKKP